MNKVHARIRQEIIDALVRWGRSLGEAEQMVRRLERPTEEECEAEEQYATTIMYFGKWKGTCILDVPKEYWGWFLAQDWAEKEHPRLYELVKKMLKMER